MLLNTLMTKFRFQINVWREVSQQRREIKKLSDHLLDDIGLTRIHADRQVNRPFWDIAENCDSSSFKHHRNTEGTPQIRSCAICNCLKYS
jgi:uncharacterized protein YjiS (DUF1127 family)